MHAPLSGARNFGFAPSVGICADGALMDRIAHAFERARSENRSAFVAYLCAGDPNLETSFGACRALIENGIDLLELGVPFSDPLADGLTNQLAAQRALESGVRTAQVLELVRRIRAISQIPIVFYTYYNLVFANGVRVSVEEASKAGVDGMLVLDLPPEESGEVWDACAATGMKTVFIVAPTTPASRLSVIAKATTGFIYYVSREGVTGVRDSVAASVPEAVAEIRKHTRLPVAVGFGISRPQHVREVASVADGVIVGSVLVNCIRDNLGKPDAIVAAVGAKARELVAGTRR